MNVRFWRDLTTRDFSLLKPDQTVALLPLGAIEQHGPHLPVSTDALIAEEMCIRAAALVPPEIPVLVMPTQNVGKSTEHLEFEGTLTHTAETLLRIWMEIGDSVARAGVRKLVFFNGHGGQPQIMEICCRELRIRHGMLCVGTGGGSFGPPTAAAVPPDERRFGIHAGMVETSIMLHLAADRVHMEFAQDFPGLLAEVERDYRLLRIIGSTYVGWQAQDLHPEGCSGNALLASAEVGKIYTDHITTHLAALLEEVSRYPLSSIRSRSSVFREE
ncbi:MAG: creatininase family protein [Pseudomonadales bacterium]